MEEVRGAWCVNRPSKSVDQLIQLADKFSGSTEIISGGKFTEFFLNHNFGASSLMVIVMIGPVHTGAADMV